MASGAQEGRTPRGGGEAESVTFHFIKSSQYRQVHADGVWGGLTPRGYIAVSFWSERGTIPRSVTHQLEGNELGGEVSRDEREGVVREVEVTTLMDLRLAVSLHRWLEDKIGDFEKATGQSLLEAKRAADPAIERSRDG